MKYVFYLHSSSKNIKFIQTIIFSWLLRTLRFVFYAIISISYNNSSFIFFLVLIRWKYYYYLRTVIKTKQSFLTCYKLINLWLFNKTIKSIRAFYFTSFILISLSDEIILLSLNMNIKIRTKRLKSANVRKRHIFFIPSRLS